MKKKKEEKSLFASFAILSYIILISAIIGFIYETIFYRIDLGYLVKRGTTIGPWVPIYGIGGALIALLTKKFDKKPWLVFIASFFITGIWEFIAGYALNHLWGLRLWNYNTEILNFGNIGGYVCLRSPLSFALGGVILISFFKPLLVKECTSKNSKTFNIVGIITGIIFLIDATVCFLLKIF